MQQSNRLFYTASSAFHSPQGRGFIHSSHRVICFAVILFSICLNAESMKADSPIIELRTGWQYRIGDSPADSSGRLIWLDDSVSLSEWTSVNSLNEIPAERQSKALWLRIRLPDWKGPSPGLFAGRVDQIMQIYLEDELLYQYGDFYAVNDNRFQSWRNHLIPLPDHFTNHWLTFRIWSDGPDIGVESPVLLGSLYDIQRDQLIGDLDDMILSSLFLLFAVALVLLFFFLRRDPLYLITALYLSVIGLFILSNSPLLMTLFHAPILFFLIDTISMFSIPIAGYLLIENVMLKKYKTIIRRLWQIHLLYLIVTLIVIQFSEKIDRSQLLEFYLAISTILMVVCAYVIFRCRKQLGHEIKILLEGILIFFSTLVIEIVFFYNTVIISGETFKLNWLPYGAFFFAASLVWLIIYRYNETNKQKNAAQKENLEYMIQNERLKGQMIRKKLESEKWQELDRLKSRFLANISHEFRTPLTLMLGTARQLIDENHNDVVTERSQMQEKQGLRLLRQVNNLLDLSKLDAGKMKLQAEEKDIISLIKGIFHSLESFARQHEIEMVFKSENESVKIFYDFNKMETIVSNLISNAVKFTRPGGKVDVIVSQNEYLEIRVADTGPGISQEHLTHIFDRFYQTGSNDVNVQKGSGIGLALTKELVKLHHGEITVESEVGKGSVFTVQLPLGREHFSEDGSDFGGGTLLTPSVPLDRGMLESEIVKVSDCEEHSQTPTSVLPQGRKLESSNANEPGLLSPDSDSELPILLIVEDNTDMRRYIREVLSEGYRIEEAADGEAGLARAAELIPDLIISDVMMPKLDGYQLCEKLKTDERTSHIPVVLLTAKSDKESKMEGLEQGADDYLVKPFESDELRVRVKNLIEQRQRLRQRFASEITIPFKEITATSSDEKFLERAVSIIKSRLDDANMSIEWFCHEMGFSRSQMHRKFQALTNQSVSEFIRSVRLIHAVYLLERNKSATVSEIAYQTGFSSPDYFRSCFKKQFGCPPSSYLSKS